MAGVAGFEPAIQESESSALPLGDTPKIHDRTCTATFMIDICYINILSLKSYTIYILLKILDITIGNKLSIAKCNLNDN